MEWTPSSAAAELAAELRAAPLPTRGISWFTRSVKGHDYWYEQFVLGPRRRSVYIGPDDVATRALISAARDMKARTVDSAPRRRALLASAQLPQPSPAVGRVIEAAAQAGVFDAGGVLLSALTGNPREVTIAVPNRTLDLVALLRDSNRAILPAPLFDAKVATTVLQLRGQRIALRLLTPQQGRSVRPQRYLPALRIVAEVADVAGEMDNATDAVCAHGLGIWIRVARGVAEQE